MRQRPVSYKIRSVSDLGSRLFPTGAMAVDRGAIVGSDLRSHLFPTGAMRAGREPPA